MRRAGFPAPAARVGSRLRLWLAGLGALSLVVFYSSFFRSHRLTSADARVTVLASAARRAAPAAGSRAAAVLVVPGGAAATSAAEVSLTEPGSAGTGLGAAAALAAPESAAATSAVAAALAAPGSAGAGSAVPAAARTPDLEWWGAELGRLEAQIDAYAGREWEQRSGSCSNRPRSFVAELGRQLVRGANQTAESERAHPKWLSRQLLRRHADADGVVIVTWANAHFSDFVENFVLSLRRLHIENYLVGALDDELVEALGRTGSVPAAHVFRMLADSVLEQGSQEHWGWGSAKFNQMGIHKGLLMRSALAMGMTLLLCDVDTVWMRDPLPFFRKYPLADLLITSDVLLPSRVAPERDAPFAAADGGLEAPTTDIGHAPFSQLLLVRSNIGVMLLRPSIAMRLFIEEYMRVLENAPKGAWDQSIFNDALRSGFSLASRRMGLLEQGEARRGRQLWEVPLDLEGVTVPQVHPDRTVMLACGLLRVGILPTPTFVHGWGFWVGRLHERFELAPYVVHNTYQYFGSLGKRMRFREAGLWHVDSPTRYATSEPVASGAGLGAPWAQASELVAGSYSTPAKGGKGVLRAALYVPGYLLSEVDMFGLSHDTVGMPVRHAALVQAQLAGAADALAIARVLRRALELPSLWCSCDRTFMVAWNCSYFPAMLKRPFRCPADHVFDLNAMERHKLPVLEAGFWDRRPAGAPADVRVHVCGARPTAGVPASPSLAALAATAGSGELADALAARCRAVEKRAAGAGGEGASARVSAFRAVNANVAATAAAAAGRGEADVSAAAEAARAALVPRGLSDAQLEQVLEPLSMFPSLAFDSTDGVFGGFEKGNNARAFKEVLERSLGMQWCCTPRGGFRFNFTAGADCASEGRVSIAEPRPNDRTLVCEGARPASGGR